MKTPPRKKKGATVASRAPLRPRLKKGDDLADLSNWLLVKYAKHQVLFFGLGHEADKLAMARLSRFIDAVREVRK